MHIQQDNTPSFQAAINKSWKQSIKKLEITQLYFLVSVLFFALGVGGIHNLSISKILAPALPLLVAFEAKVERKHRSYLFYLNRDI